MKHNDRIRVRLNSTTVGELGVGKRGRLYFQYDLQWLANGFDLSPGTLEFNTKPQQSPEPSMFGGLHGVFNDSLPDGWGLLLMDRALREKAGWRSHEITPLDRLAYIGNRAMGALEYEPALPLTDESETVNIYQLAQSSGKLLRGETREVLQQLQIHGGSPGGARPKVTVARSADSDQCVSGYRSLPQGFQHWIVKFRSREDPIDAGRCELAYARMATLAGIDMPDSELLKVGQDETSDEFFAVRRFDRQKDSKLHMISLSGYVYADHRIPSIDYESMIKATYNITRNMAEAEKAYRLMLFNVLAHNKDDHSKNFAFIYRNDAWEFSPAFDLTFNTGINNQHSTDIAGSGNPQLMDVRRVAENCGIKGWRTILNEVKAAITQWDRLAANEGVSLHQIEKINSALLEIKQRF